MVRVEISVDGVAYSDEVEPRTLLVQYLRETLGMSGVNVGCDTSNCGACTIHLDGRSVKSCTVLAAQADGSDVTTVRGLAASANGDVTGWHPVQRAFHDLHGLQCGFCTPGMIMSAIDLLGENGDPTDAEIREGLEGNLCRCTGYQNIVRAVRQAADEMAGRAESDPDLTLTYDVGAAEAAQEVGS